MSERASERDPLILDPLALPSETTGRFRMLVVAAFVMAWGLVGEWFPTPWLPTAFEEATRGAFSERDGRMVLSEGFDLQAFLSMPGGSPVALAEAQSQARRLHVALVAMPGFLLLSWVLYRLIPGRTVRRLGARRLDPAAAPRLASELAELSTLAGVGAAIEWHTRPGFLDGLACGAGSRARVIVAGDPRRLDRGLSEMQRAVLLHELGHIANHDVKAREKARCAWIVLGLFGAATPVLVLAQGFSWARLAGVSLRLAACSALGLGLWAGLVRAREHLADWRVVRCGLGAALARRLGVPGVGREQYPRETRSLLARVKSALAMHPTQAERLEVLSKPAGLFRVSPALAFSTGALLALTVGHLGLVVVHVVVVVIGPVAVWLLVGGGVPPTLFAPVGFLLAAAIFVPLTHWVAGALGIQLLRAALADMSGEPARWGYRRLLGPALAFMAGFELGLWLTPLGAVVSWSATPLVVVWLCAFTALVWLWLIQVRALGRLVLGNVSDGANAVRTERWLRATAVVLLVPVIAPSILIRTILAAAVNLAQGAKTSVFGVDQDTLAMIGVEWCFDLLSLALSGTAILGLAILAVAGLRLLRRIPACRRCGERSRACATVGLRCPRCGEPAAAWLYAHGFETAGAGTLTEGLDATA